MDTAFSKAPDKKAAEEMAKKDTPLGRGTTPRDIAVAVAFFASDLTSDIVGQILSISGGSTFQ
jgi:NAD(P)-dependent dehydrogenase (short-subunit alcohol dehydrogenase family)